MRQKRVNLTRFRICFLDFAMSVNCGALNIALFVPYSYVLSLFCYYIQMLSFLETERSNITHNAPIFRTQIPVDS